MGKYKVLSRDSWSNTRKFLVDTESDLNLLPKTVGSIALVVETNDEYILNNKRKWIKLKKNNSTNNENFIILDDEGKLDPDILPDRVVLYDEETGFISTNDIPPMGGSPSVIYTAEEGEDFELNKKTLVIQSMDRGNIINDDYVGPFTEWCNGSPVFFKVWGSQGYDYGPFIYDSYHSSGIILCTTGQYLFQAPNLFEPGDDSDIRTFVLDHAPGDQTGFPILLY